jgi:hypothetical protein
MLPEYLENLLKEYCLLECAFQEDQSKAKFDEVYANAMEVYEQYSVWPNQEEQFAGLLRDTIAYLR